MGAHRKFIGFGREQRKEITYIISSCTEKHYEKVYAWTVGRIPANVHF